MSEKAPRVLLLHNRYRQPGGEDAIVQAQAQLLRERGHAVRVFEKDNREIDSYGLARKGMLFLEMSVNSRSAKEVDEIARDIRGHIDARYRWRGV